MNKDNSSITLLIPALKSGETAAWNSLCNKFHVVLANKSRRLFRSSQLKKGSTDDLVQETLVKAWAQHSSFRGDTTAQFSVWLMRILRNTFIDWNRGAKIELSQPTWYGFTSKDGTPSALAISNEQESNLYAALAELDEGPANILMLRHFEGMKFAEIAQETDTNINTVVGIYRRAVLKLKDLVQK